MIMIMHIIPQKNTCCKLKLNFIEKKHKILLFKPVLWWVAAVPKQKTHFSRIPPASQQRDSYSSWQQLNRSPCSPYMDSNQNTTSRSITQFESTNSLNDKKVKVSPDINSGIND